MTKKFKLQHLGYPTTNAIPEHAWKDLSEHASATAALKRKWKHEEHLERWTWDDHYRIVSPDGEVMDIQAIAYEIEDIRMTREVNRLRRREERRGW